MQTLLSVIISISYFEEMVAGLIHVGEDFVQYEFHKARYMFARGDGMEIFGRHEIVLKRYGFEIQIDQEEYKALLKMFFAVMDAINEDDIYLMYQLIEENSLAIQVNDSFPTTIYGKIIEIVERDEMEEEKNIPIDV